MDRICAPFIAYCIQINHNSRLMSQVQWKSLIDDLVGLIDKKANDLDVYYALDRILDEVRSGGNFADHIEALLQAISPMIASVNWHMIQSVLFGAQQIVEQFLRLIQADIAANNNPSLLSRYSQQIEQWLQDGGVWLTFIKHGVQYKGKREVRDAAAQFIGALSLFCSALPAPLVSPAWYAELIQALLQWSDAQKNEPFETLEGTMMAMGYWLYKAQRQVLDDATHLQLIARLEHYTRYDNAQDNARYIRLQALRGLERAVRAGSLTSTRDQLFAHVIAPSLADNNIDVRKAAAQLMTSWARVVSPQLSCTAVSALLDHVQSSVQWEQRHGISHALYLVAQDRALVERLDSALIARTMTALTEQVRHTHSESKQPRGVTVVANAAALTALSELCMTLHEPIDAHLLPVITEALVSPLDLLQDAAGRAFYRLGTAAPQLLGTHRLELLALTYKSLFHSSHPIQELANRTRRDLAGDAQALVREEWPRLMQALLREIASENPDVREAVWKAIDELSGQQLAGLGAEPWCAQIIAAAQHSLATEKSEFALAATCRALARYVALIEDPAQVTAPFWALLAALWTDTATATGTVLTAAVECLVALLTGVNSYQPGPVPDPLVLAWIGLARDDEPMVRSSAVWSYARVTKHLTPRTVIDTTRNLLNNDKFEDRWCDIAVTWGRYGSGIWSRATPDERKDACHVALAALVGPASDDSAALAAWIHVLHDLTARDTSVTPALASSMRSALLHVLTDSRSELDIEDLAEWADHLPEDELNLAEARDIDGAKKKGKAKDKRQQALAYWLKLTAVSELFAHVTHKFAQSEDEISSKYVELITSAVESLKAGDILLHYFGHVIDTVNKHDSTLGQQLVKLRPVPATQNLEEISAHWKSVKLSAEQWATLLSQSRAALTLVSGSGQSHVTSLALVKSAVALLDQCIDQQDSLATRLLRAQLLHVISTAVKHVQNATVDDARDWLATTWSTVNDADNALSPENLEDPTADQSKEVEQWTHATAHAPFTVSGLVLHLDHVTGNLLTALGDERDELLEQVREEAFNEDTDESESAALLAALASVVQHTRQLDAALWMQCVQYLVRTESLQNEQHYYIVARILHTLAQHLTLESYVTDLRRVLEHSTKREVIHVDEGKSAAVLFSVGYKLSEIEPSTALQQQLSDMIFNEDIEDECHMALLSSVTGTLPLPTRQESLTANETFHKTAQNIA